MCVQPQKWTKYVSRDLKKKLQNNAPVEIDDLLWSPQQNLVAPLLCCGPAGASL